MELNKEFDSKDPNTLHEGEENPFLSLIIKDLNGFYIRYDIISSNLVIGIRQFLLDIPIVCTVTNYDLVVDTSGKKLEDYESVYEVGLTEYQVIKMVPSLYTNTSANFHLNRLNYILNTQAPFINKSVNNLDVVSRDLDTLITNSKLYFSKMTDIRQKMMGIYDKREDLDKTADKGADKVDKADKAADKVDKTDEKEYKAADKANKADTNTNTKFKKAPVNVNADTPNPNADASKTPQSIIEDTLKSLTDIREKISEMDFKKFSLVNFTESFVYEDIPKPQKFKCLNSIHKSFFNNTIKDNEMNGDLIYIDVHTLEGTKLSVTCSEKGFYVNNSNISNGIFDPKPSSYPCFSYTIVGLLCQASPQFKENFSKLISQVLNIDATLFLPSPSTSFEWLKSAENENPFFYNYRYKSFNSEMESLKHMRLNKEWNEEYQAIIDLNFNGDPLQNLTKEKLLYDFYKMFKETSIEGVKLIRDKKITAFNFFDNPKANSGYYMYGSIFFTVLEDNYLDFRTFTSDDQRQTCLGSNLDLRHINYLNSIRHTSDLKDFYFSLNCIVQYKGLRVHAQVITPGVIFNSEHLVEYGEGEEGVLKYNEQFHEAYKSICEKLNIRVVTITDKNNKEYKICGNPEIKGVRGVDKRKYLFDLIHLFPRDLNYEGANNNGCLLRPELIKEYQLKQIHKKTTTDYAEQLKKINVEIPRESIQDATSYFQYMEERYKMKEELFEKVNIEIKPTLTLDTTIGVENKNFTFTRENLSKDEELLRNLSSFLKDEILKKFLIEISRDEEYAPNDCFSITEYLHRYGIPVRYYGEIIKLIENDSNFKNLNNWVKSLIIRDILRRSAKHVFNNILKDLPDYLIKEFCAYFLNIFIGPSASIKTLENYEMVYIQNTITNVKPARNENDKENQNQTLNSKNIPKAGAKIAEDKKKKKNKNKKKKNKENKTSDKTTEELELKYLISESLSNTNKYFSSIYEIEDVRKFFIKPSELWSEIKKISEKRYGYIFPEKHNFDYVDPIINKFGLLRDLCLTVGIQIEALDYELQFDNSSNRVEQFKYSQMPFKSKNIIDFFPLVKDSNLPSEIHKPIFEQAEALFRNSNFIEASEKYKQIIYLSNEVYGQINHYSAVSHKKLGEIAYLEGDYMNGIMLLQKSIVIFEKLYKFDSNLVANAYSELSTYYHLINQDYLAFKYINRSLEILNFTYPKNHPEVINRICNLTMYYVDVDLIENAKDLIESTIKLCNNFFDEDDKNLQRGWLIISHLSLKTYNLNRAIFSYEKYLNIVRKSSTDQNVIKLGEKILEGLKTISDELKKKQGLMKSKDDTKKIFEELCKKYVLAGYWEDLEKPMHKFLFNMNSTDKDNPLFSFMKKKE